MNLYELVLLLLDVSSSEDHIEQTSILMDHDLALERNYYARDQVIANQGLCQLKISLLHQVVEVFVELCVVFFLEGKSADLDQ
jgi:hypothetical protein